MFTTRTTREAILERLKSKVEARTPITVASAGSGLVAQLLEKAGVDCINTFSGARLRANGMGTMSMMWPILDSNAQTLTYTSEDIMPALKGDSFVCACLNANDPLKEMAMVLERVEIDAGAEDEAFVSAAVAELTALIDRERNAA